jgi:hypothetical protein
MEENMNKGNWSRQKISGKLFILCINILFLSGATIRWLTHPYKEDLRFIILYICVIGIFSIMFIWLLYWFNKRKDWELARFSIGQKDMKNIIESILEVGMINYQFIKRNRIFSIYAFSFKLSDLNINIDLSGSLYESRLSIGPITENNKVIIEEIQNKIDSNASSRNED